MKTLHYYDLPNTAGSFTLDLPAGAEALAVITSGTDPARLQVAEDPLADTAPRSFVAVADDGTFDETGARYIGSGVTLIPLHVFETLC